MRIMIGISANIPRRPPVGSRVNVSPPVIITLKPAFVTRENDTRLVTKQWSMRKRPANRGVFAMAGSGERDVWFAVILIGDSGVGKSCVMKTYVEDSPPENYR